MKSTVRNGKGDKNRTKDHKSYWMSPYWELVEKKKKESKNEKSNRS